MRIARTHTNWLTSSLQPLHQQQTTIHRKYCRMVPLHIGLLLLEWWHHVVIREPWTLTPHRCTAVRGIICPPGVHQYPSFAMSPRCRTSPCRQWLDSTPWTRKGTWTQEKIPVLAAVQLFMKVLRTISTVHTSARVHLVLSSTLQTYTSRKKYSGWTSRRGGLAQMVPAAVLIVEPDVKIVIVITNAINHTYRRQSMTSVTDVADCHVIGHVQSMTRMFNNQYTINITRHRQLRHLVTVQWSTAPATRCRWCADVAISFRFSFAYPR